MSRVTSSAATMLRKFRQSLCHHKRLEAPSEYRWSEEIGSYTYVEEKWCCVKCGAMCRTPQSIGRLPLVPPFPPTD